MIALGLPAAQHFNLLISGRARCQLGDPQLLRANPHVLTQREQPQANLVDLEL